MNNIVWLYHRLREMFMRNCVSHLFCSQEFPEISVFRVSNQNFSYFCFYASPILFFFFRAYSLLSSQSSGEHVQNFCKPFSFHVCPIISLDYVFDFCFLFVFFFFFDVSSVGRDLSLILCHHTAEGGGNHGIVHNYQHVKRWPPANILSCDRPKLSL